ncbi:MAG: prolyl oligopeptidase family serine peptidase, partial [Clostridia bacterium]|nr:prolyl oligopeptidase family serine peptidase [Clostridia bacterium]
DERVLEKLGIEKDAARPDASILCYPVVTAVRATHRLSVIHLYGRSEDVFTQDELERVSLELQVTDQTPPAFIWTTADDGCVPSQNSLLYANALNEHGVPYELHVFPSGAHGLSFATRHTAPMNNIYYIMPYVARWAEMADRWLDATFYG